MDPAVFFGRSRQTRQTLKSNQSASEQYANREVTTRSKRSCVENSGKVTKALASVQPEASVNKDTSKVVKGRGKKKPKENYEDGPPAKGKGQKPCLKKKKVHFDEDEKTEPDTPSQTGPVYKNVRRSDVHGEPSDEYEFPVDENDEPLRKKKKPRKVNTAKKNNNHPYGVVIWDPSKRPILKKTVACKSVKPKARRTVETALPQVGATFDIASTGLNSVSKSQPPKAGKITKDTAKVPCNSAPKNMTNHSSIVAMPSSTAKFSDPKVQGSTSSSKSSSCFMPAEEGLEEPGMLSMQTSTPSAPNQTENNIRKASASKPVSCGSKTSGGVSPLIFKAGNHFSSTPVASPRHVQCTPKGVVSPAASQTAKGNELISKSQQSRRSIHTPASKSSAVPIICVRESPSFLEPENLMDSLNVNDVLSSSKSIGDITSTPVTRSKSTQSFELVHTTRTPLSAASPSPKQVTNSPVPVLSSAVKSSWTHENNVSNDDTFEIFNDIPSTSIIPTRMFSTHRGTIFVPQTEKNVSKRKLPALSPSKAVKHARSTTVKFSVPQAASNLDDCFGFDEDDPKECSSVPQPQKNTLQSRVTKNREIKKPNLSIQEVHAILRGQLKTASPANSTPRTLQTKLTDFVSSTPSTPSRSSPNLQPSILTPTPVPLFGEEEIDREIPSPFIQPLRRSYDRFQRGKRIVCGDEVHSDEEEGDLNVPRSVASANPEVKKKNHSYRKKKKPANTQLDTWANELASHFDELEDVELQVE